MAVTNSIHWFDTITYLRMLSLSLFLKTFLTLPAITSTI